VIRTASGHRKGWEADIRLSRLNDASAPIPLKNSENEGRQKIGVWSCKADSATRCHANSLRPPHTEKSAFLPKPVALSS
jgi:hypothetical protein